MELQKFKLFIFYIPFPFNFEVDSSERKKESRLYNVVTSNCIIFTKDNKLEQSKISHKMAKTN